MFYSRSLVGVEFSMKSKEKSCTIATYDIAERYLEKIIKWFELSYGIRISATQALAFSFHTIDTLSKKTIQDIDKKIKIGFRRYYISVSPQLKDHLYKIINRSAVFSDTALFIASVIITRALTLPSVPHAKLREYEILIDSWHENMD